MKKIKTDCRWGVNCSVVQLLKSLGGRHAMKINVGRSTFFQWAKSTIVKIKELKHVLKEKYVIFVHVRLTVEDLIK